MKPLVSGMLFLFLLFCTSLSSCAIEEDPLQEELTRELSLKAHYDSEKQARIAALTQRTYRNLDEMTLGERYDAFDRLREEYLSYSFDSAYRYTTELRDCGLRMDDDHKLDSRTKYSFVLSNGGFFKEAVDSLTAIDASHLEVSTKVRADYYIALGRIYHNLADYTADDIYNPLYNRLGNEALAKALPLVADTSTTLWLHGKIALKEGNLKEARNCYEQAAVVLAGRDSISTIIHSTLGGIYNRFGEYDLAIEYYTTAAIINIKSAKTESVALRGLATVLFYYKHDVNRATEYINIALDDATTYSSRHRQLIIGNLLPIIVGEKLNIIEANQRQLIRYLTLIAILAVALIIISAITVSQMFKLRRQRRMLVEINKNLSESNLIKEEYIGHYFHINSEIVSRVDRFVKVANHKLDHRQYDSLRQLIEKLNQAHNKETIYEDFDRTFLKIFPTFVEKFNELMPVNDRIQVEAGSLNPTLRIFALIRLGITDSEEIATIIDYSLNTVYNYRTRIRKKSLVEADKFEELIRDIG